MRISKVELVYFSPVFHSRAISRVLGYELASRLNLSFPDEHDLTHWANADERADFNQEHLTVFSVPVYGGRTPAVAAQRIKNFLGHNTPAILMASYGNREYEDALVELQDIVSNSGFKPIAACACIAQHTIAPIYGAGRPNLEDERQIRDFAGEVSEMVRTIPEEADVELTVPGNRPYKNHVGAPLPQTVAETCEHCGLCAAQCPTRAIDAGNEAAVDAKACICCMRCVNICPVKARQPAQQFIDMITEKLAPACSQPKKNQFFLAKIL